MIGIIIGNILSLIATLLAMHSGTRKYKQDMIVWDMAMASCFTAADFVLKGYSGVVVNIVGVLRDFTTLYIKNNKIPCWILVICGVIFGVYFNNQGFIGLLPVATSFYYSICAISEKASEKHLKIALILNNLAFAIYCAILWNLVGVITDTMVVITLSISYYRTYLKK